MFILRLAGEANREVVVAVDGSENESSANAHDANWLRCSVVVDVGAFHGTALASFTTHDFARFLSELDQALAGQRSAAVFEPDEGSLALRIEFDRTGHAKIRGRLRESESELSFLLETDQFLLAAAQRDLRRIVTQFPERG